VIVTGYAGSPNDVYWEIFDAGTGTKIGTSTFHVSCSDPNMNDVADCGKLQGDGKDKTGFLNHWIFEGMSGNGQVLSCTPPPPLPPSSSCSAVLGPTPSCKTEGKPTSLAFRFTGGGCSATNNPQGGKATCTGGIDPSLPVTVQASSKDGKTVYSVSPVVVAPDGEFTVAHGSFAADSMVRLTNAGGTETIVFHTSCSQVLEVGNTFGSATLVGFNGKRADLEVDYTCVVTNTSGTTALPNVGGVDDHLGSIFGGVSLQPGESRTFTRSTTISATTTNNLAVLATSMDPSLTCNAAASATVTVGAPPLPIAACSELKPIDGIKLEFSPSLAGRTIDRVEWYRTTVSDINHPRTADLVGSTTWPTATGDVFTFSGFAGRSATNDVDFIVYFTDGSKVISRFHRSCSDADMNDVTDCGKVQGNAKTTDSRLGNFWLLRDLVGNGKRLGCQ
jgi:hypothetical protein